MLMGVVPMVTAFDAGSETEALRRRLPEAVSGKDSIKILYNVFDLATRPQQGKVAREIYDVAWRNKEYGVCLDIIRQMSVLYHKDSIFDLLQKETLTLPRNRERDETMLFIKMRQAVYNARMVPETERQKEIAKLIASETTSANLDKDQNLLRTFTLVEYLSNGIGGELFDKYVGKLSKEFKASGVKLYALRNLLLTEQANLYTASENQKKAVAADRELIEVIKGLEKEYAEQGRTFRNYDTSYFIAYRRMLGNFEALTPAEVQEYYKKILELQARNSDVAATMKVRNKSKMHYAMATGNYAEAIPLIQFELTKEKSLPRRRTLLRWLVDASKATGDNATQLQALEDYNKILKECDDLRAAERYKELQIKYDVNELRAQNAELKVKSTQHLMTFVLVGWLIFGVLLVVLLWMWARYHRMNVKLQNFVSKLSEERDYLKERTYYDYHKPEGSHSAAPQHDVRSVERPKRKKDVQAMIDYVINDIVYISSIGRNMRRKYVHSFGVADAMKKAARKVAKYESPALHLDTKLPEAELKAVSDLECVEYVLNYILESAMTVSPRGRVIFECEDDAEAGLLKFRYTHLDVIVPPGKEEVMFDDIVSVAQLEKRQDAGLFLCRLVSLLLDSSVRLDPECEKGSRYIFTIRKRMNG